MDGSLARIGVVGTSCAGKTTLAANLARRLRARHIELDALFWGPNWRPAPGDEFRARVAAEVAQDAWIVDGNYSQVRDIVWARATRVVWLNYTFPLVFCRALRRTLERIARKTELFSGNRETFRAQFLSRDSLLLWVIATHRRHRIYRRLLSGNEFPHLTATELRNPSECARFLESLNAPCTPGD